jgi:hypothetical protein
LFRAEIVYHVDGNGRIDKIDETRIIHVEKGTGMSAPYGRGELMAIAAVRYCLGRQSYIVGDCVDWLIEVWPALQESTRFIIKRDINEAFARDDNARANGDKYKPLGMDMDCKEWDRVRGLWE